MKKYIVLFLLAPFMLFSQQPAVKQIREMKNTMLLVRLKTAEHQISALKQAGHEEKAREMEVKRDRENREVCQAFRDNFTFCPVYFFYSSSTGEVKNGNWPAALMDADLNPVRGLARPVPTFYVAEFGNIEKTDEKYYSGTGMGTNPEGRKQQQDYYYGSPDFGFSALVIRDNQFVQLRDPFPYYVRTFESLPLFARKKSKAVKKLDRKLHDFYTSVISKPQ